MRDLGSAYDVAVETAGSEPRYQVQLRGWGGAPDPLDISSRVSGWSLSRSLRGAADSATLVIDNSDGIFDAGAAWGAALLPNVATVEIEAGERIGGTESLWRVFTGGVLSSRQTEQTPGAPLRVSLGNRGRNLAAIRITSQRYGDPIVPVNWEALDIIKDLFVEFAGFVDPDDFNFPALSFLTSGVQFEGESLLSAANACLQPKGRALHFAYDGRLSHRLLIPADWTPDLTLVAGMAARIESERRPPIATRIFVTGGPSTEPMPVIGEAEVWATGGYRAAGPALYDYAGRGTVDTAWGLGQGHADGQLIPWGLFGQRAYLDYAGPKDQRYRIGHSFVDGPYPGLSRGDVAPVLDMTVFPLEIDMNIAIDGGAPNAVVFAWAGCTTGPLVAAELQAKIRALGGAFATVDAYYVVDAGVSDHYRVRSGVTGVPSQVVITDGAPNNCADRLKLGVVNGGTETLGGGGTLFRWIKGDVSDVDFVEVEDNPTLSEVWNVEAERQEICLHIEMQGPAWDANFDFDIYGYPLPTTIKPSVDTQAWDDVLISLWGEIKKSVQAPLALTYEDSNTVADMELVFAQKSGRPVSITLPRADLRIEPGDVSRFPYRGGTIDVWVHSVALAYDNGPKHLHSIRGFIL